MDQRQSPESSGDGRASQRAASTTERFAAMAHEGVDRAAEPASRAEAEIRERAARAAQRARESEERAVQAVDERISRVASYVEQNPLLSAGIAFTAGLVLSALIRR